MNGDIDWRTLLAGEAEESPAEGFERILSTPPASVDPLSPRWSTSKRKKRLSLQNVRLHWDITGEFPCVRTADGELLYQVVPANTAAEGKK